MFFLNIKQCGVVTKCFCEFGSLGLTQEAKYLLMAKGAEKNYIGSVFLSIRKLLGSNTFGCLNCLYEIG